MAECGRQLVLEPYLVLLNDVIVNTFDIIDICVLCVWHDLIKEIYYYYTLLLLLVLLLLWLLIVLVCLVHSNASPSTVIILLVSEIHH